MIATGLLFVHARCKGYLSFNTSLSHSLSCSLSLPLLSPRLHSLLFSWIFSPPVIYLILSLYPPLHTEARTHTQSHRHWDYTIHIPVQRNFSRSLVCAHGLSHGHTCSAFTRYRSTHTHTHTHSGLLCVFVSEGRDCWAHSYVKDAWFRNCFLRWHDCSSVCVCVHMHDRAHEYQVVSFPKNKRHAPSCQMVYLKWWKTCLLIKLRISVLSLILKAEKLPSYMTSWGRLDIYSMLSCDDWDSLAGVGTQEKFGL